MSHLHNGVCDSVILAPALSKGLFRKIKMKELVSHDDTFGFQNASRYRILYLRDLTQSCLQRQIRAGGSATIFETYRKKGMCRLRLQSSLHCSSAYSQEPGLTGLCDRDIGLYGGICTSRLDGAAWRSTSVVVDDRYLNEMLRKLGLSCKSIALMRIARTSSIA